MKINGVGIVFKIVAMVAIFMLTGSCEHKDLCYYHPHVAPVRIEVDWEAVNKGDLDAMTGYMFTRQEYNQEIKTAITTNNIRYVDFDLLEGEYSVAVFNSTPEELVTLEFFDLTDYDNASVQVVETKVSWYKSYVKSDDKFVAHSPEWIARGLAENVIVTKEMVDLAEKEYIENGFSMDKRTINKVDKIIPDTLTRKFKVNVQFKGIDNFYQARAVVSGLAIGRKVISMQPLNETVAHVIAHGGYSDADENGWKLLTDTLAPDGIGELSATFTCFGLPANHSGAPTDNYLTIEVILVDRATRVVCDPIPIGHLIGVDDNDNLFLTQAVMFPKDLPYVKPEDGKEGGFDVDIEDWEDEDIEILDH